MNSSSATTGNASEPKPRITVIMPVYNGMPFLRQTINSLLDQSEGNFLAFVFNDGSSDGTGDYLDSITDQRIIVRHQKNMGLAKTLNAMIEEVDTEYVARMDSDDVCMPERFAKQLDFLDRHRDVAVVGSRQGYVAGEKSIAEINLGFWRIVPSYLPRMADPPFWHPYNDRQILVHSSVMMRTSALREVGGYPEIVPGQDLGLWYRFSRAGWKLANLDEILLLFRISSGGISSKNLVKQYYTWSHIADSWRREEEGEPEITLEEFMAANPLSGKEVAHLAARAKLRNAMATFLEGRHLAGAGAIMGVALRHPSLFMDKLKSRIRSAG